MCIMSSQTISSEKKGIIRNALQTALRHPFDIKVLQVKNMRQGTNGKFEEFISEI